MMHNSSALLVAAILQIAAGVSSAAMAAQPQSQGPRINVDLSWEGAEPPQIVLHSPDGGRRDYSSSVQPIRINQAAGRWSDRYRLVVHYPGVDHEFAVRPRVNEPAFGLRLRSPVGRACDTPVVTQIAGQARSSNPEGLANAGLTASYLRSLSGNRCSDIDEGRLREALINSHCQLARNTTFFFVPDMPWDGAARRVNQCRQAVMMQSVGQRLELAGTQAAAGAIAEMDATLADLRALRTDPEWQAAFAGINDTNLHRIEVHGLFNTIGTLRSANDRGARPLAARLALLSNRDDYRDAFQQAGLSRDLARRLDRQVQASLARPDR